MSPQLCTSADVDMTGGDQVDGVPRLALGDGEGQLGVRVDEGSHCGGDQASDRGREGREPEVTGHGARGPVQAGLDPLQVAEQPASVVDQLPPGTGQHHAAAHPLEQRHPDLPLEPLDLLGDRARGVPEHLGRGDHRAMAVDGTERDEGIEINHAATLHEISNDYSLVLHGHCLETGRHVPS